MPTMLAAARFATAESSPTAKTTQAPMSRSSTFLPALAAPIAMLSYMYWYASWV